MRAERTLDWVRSTPETEGSQFEGKTEVDSQAMAIVDETVEQRKDAECRRGSRAGHSYG